MADVTISQLTPGDPPVNSLIPFSDGSSTKSSTLYNLFKQASGMLLGGNLIFTQDLTEYFIKPPANGGAIRFRSNAQTGADRQLELGHIDNNNVWSSIMTIAEGGYPSEGGYVGVNTRTPSVALDVNGDIRASGSLLIRGTRIQECFYEHSDPTVGLNIYYHYKTNIPINSDCMYRIKAEGYHYQGANKLIEGWWSGYAYNNGNNIINSQSINSSVASNFCNRQYKSSDGYVVLVGFVSGNTYYYNVWFSFKSGTTSNTVGKINVTSVLKTTDSSANLF